MNVPEYVEILVDAGIPVTIDKSDKLGIYFNLNLESKSHLYLFERDGEWFADMRYDKQIKIESWNDLMWAAKDGMHGRDFIHYKWEELLVKEGVLRVDIQTTKSYS
jgi:hypothetical protein